MSYRITTIIVTYNNEDTLEQCLGSVLDNGPASSHMVLVVDNCSSDNTRKIVNRYSPRVELIALEKNVGFGAANNIAMKSVDSEYYYLHNPDAYLTSDSLIPALECFGAYPDTGILGLPLVYPDYSPQTSAYAFSSPTKWLLQIMKIDQAAKWLIEKVLPHWILGYLRKIPIASTFVDTYSKDAFKAEGPSADGIPRAESADWVTGAALILKREVLDCTGGFDENIFLYGEDEDLCINASIQNFRVRKVFVEPVVHDVGWNRKKATAHYSQNKYESLCYFIHKHFTGFRKTLMLILLDVRMKGWTASMRDYLRNSA